jgi:hypothetical protein
MEKKGGREKTLYIRGPVQKSGIMPLSRMQFVFWSPHKSTCQWPYETTLSCQERQTSYFRAIFSNCIISDSVEDGGILATRKRTCIATLAVQTAA